MSSIAILHVEDDTRLAEVVAEVFASFGFRGAILHAETVAAAMDMIKTRTSQNQSLDMILVDMNLPDGNGLEVVKSVKTNPAWASIPVLLLTNEIDDRFVAEAYALGVNCYLPKNSDDLFHLLESVHDCWFESGLHPAIKKRDPLEELLGQTVSYKKRTAEFYARLARVFKTAPEWSRFWLSLSIFQSNQANFAAFILRSHTRFAFSPPFFKELKEYTESKDAGLHAVLNTFENNPRPTQAEALGWALEVESSFDPGILASAMSMFFHTEPAVTAAYLESMSSYLLELTRRALYESSDPKTHQAADTLMARAVALRQEFRPAVQ
jgi:CheY-like chemotaxis protein